MDSRLLRDDLAKAVQQLEKALQVPAQEDLIRAGCIQYFEFCFELSWKAIKLKAEEQGLMDCVSPRAAFKRAFALGWIDEEKAWLDMISDRNRMSHTYNVQHAMDIYARLPDYLKAFQNLLKKIS